MKDAMELLERQVQLLTLSQLYSFLQKGKPLFSSTSYQDKFYESLDDSFGYLTEFLKLQLEDSMEEFVIFLYDLLNKNSGKTNCLNIIGPPSSGKTYFARIVKEALVVSGMIGNMNNRSPFPYNNYIDKRVLHWDEPSFDPFAIEQIKCLFSGDEYTCNIKYKNNASLMRTPVIVTANTYVWPREEAFNVRIRTYRFKSAPMLKNLRNLNPLCLYKLFEYYNLME